MAPIPSVIASVRKLCAQTLRAKRGVCPLAAGWNILQITDLQHPGMERGDIPFIVAGAIVAERIPMVFDGGGEWDVPRRGGRSAPSRASLPWRPRKGFPPPGT